MNEYLSFDVCRTCLKKLNTQGQPFSVYDISELLMSYASITVLENDGLPSTVCSNCHSRANEAYKFKLLCEESDRKLRTNLNTQLFIKQEIPYDDKLLNNGDSNHDHLYSSTIPKTLESLAVNNTNIVEIKDSMDDETPSNRSNKIKSNDTQMESSKKTEKVLMCRFCSTTFINRTRLVKHEIKHGNGIKCYICGKDFATVKQLASHISIHNRKGAHLCQTCGKQFTMPENLARHQRIHMGIRPYKCKVCNKSFTQSNELKSHMISHSSEKTHLCNVCGNKYARHMSLQIHIRRLHSHSSTMRPYQCETCGRSFKDKRDLSQHNTIHKGERRHICNICNKAFNRSSNLKVHERIHSGFRPFVCSVCQKGFIQKHVLITHMKTHPSVP